MADLDLRSLPMIRSLQRLAYITTSASASGLLCRLLNTMRPGGEVDHLRHLLRFADRRGGEIRLSLLDKAGGQQLLPNPAFVWKWKAVQSYEWYHEQHINVLEFVALFNYLRSLSNKRNLQHLGLFHVMDSKVVCGICSKGRSSSRRLNRCCRRLLPFALGMDWYLVRLWTIWRWQPADQASRTFDDDGGH